MTLITGSMDHGQGHGTTFKQILSEKLGIDADRIRYRYGDSDLVTNSIGTFGSRSAMLAGSAIVVASERIIERGKKVAAHMMEAVGRRHRLSTRANSPSPAPTARSGSTTWCAARSTAPRLPKDVDPGFSERADCGPARRRHFPQRRPYLRGRDRRGHRHASRWCAMPRWTMSGAMLNPLLCDGQIYGGIVQGIGQALVEDLVYDKASGQLLTGSFQDYCMPRADDFCDLKLGSNVSLTPRNPLGVKGVGEAGTIGALPAVMNAVNDALHRAGAPRNRNAGDARESVARAAGAEITYVLRLRCAPLKDEGRSTKSLILSGAKRSRRTHDAKAAQWNSTYSYSNGSPLMPRSGGAIQPAILPGSVTPLHQALDEGAVALARQPLAAAARAIPLPAATRPAGSAKRPAQAPMERRKRALGRVKREARARLLDACGSSAATPHLAILDIGRARHLVHRVAQRHLLGRRRRRRVEREGALACRDGPRSRPRRAGP